MGERPSERPKAAAATIEQALDELPIFPLPQVVLFPRALLPLHIFEPRYRALLKDCLGTHGFMAIARITEGPGRDRDEALPKIAEVVGVGKILEHHPLPDGRSNILLHGVARVRLAEMPFVPPYRRAKATVLHDVPAVVPHADRTALLAAANSLVAELHKRDPGFSFQLPPSLEPGAIADLCAHHLVIDADARQTILEELNVAERVRRTIDLLAMQHAEISKDREGTLH